MGLEGFDAVQINISTRHGHISEATRSKITAKLERLPRLFERLTAIEVTVDLEHKDAPTVDLRVSAEHKHDFLATERAGDLMTSIDGTIHKVEQQLRKYKQKVQDHHKSPGLRQQNVPGEQEAAGE
ncbi:MAG: ribosome-associated translation inhibitor RaiA [Pirellulales bacterium]